MIVLIGGRDRAGKSTLSTQLSPFLNLAPIRSFATDVKQIARDSFGWDGSKSVLGRRLLRDVGETGRRQNTQFWVAREWKKLEQAKLDYSDFILFDDWRFIDGELLFFQQQELPVTTVWVSNPLTDDNPLEEGEHGIPIGYRCDFHYTHEESPQDLLNFLKQQKAL